MSSPGTGLRLISHTERVPEHEWVTDAGRGKHIGRKVLAVRDSHNGACT